jgi:hypothetical protein
MVNKKKAMSRGDLGGGGGGTKCMTTMWSMSNIELTQKKYLRNYCLSEEERIMAHMLVPQKNI